MRSRISSMVLLVLVGLAISTHAGAQTNQPPTISGTPSSTAIVRETYHFLPSATDPEGTRLSWSIANKPAWAAFSGTTGRLTGAPGYSHIGTVSNIVITVSDGSQRASLPPFSITVSTAGSNSPPVISGVPPTTATVRQTYHFLPSASDPDKQKLYWSISNRPAWASFSTTTGRLTGAPGVSHAGTTVSNIVITVSDGSKSASLAPFSITVSKAASSPPPSPPPSVSVTTSSQLPDGTVGAAYSVTLEASGGTSPYRWEVSSGSLPAGLSLDQSTGVISGTPTSAVTANPTIVATDANASTASKAFSLQISPAQLAVTTPPQLPNGKVGTAYSVTLAATGGTAPYQWQVTAGSLPAGLSLNQTTGVISGTPTSAVIANPTIAVTDASASSASAAFSVQISTASLVITTPQQLPAGTAGTSYSVTLAATGGTAPYRWQVASGSLLPSALALDPVTGVISGTPANAGTASFGIAVTDANAVSANATFSLTINSAAPSGWQLVWSDEFNGSGAVDSNTWGYEIGQVRNQEPQYFTNRLENVRQENGSLIVEARKESYNGAQYTSASILTRDKRSFLYGRIEVRAKIPGGRGTWPAIWMMGTSGGGWPARGEIDIMENVGWEGTIVHAAKHTSSGSSILHSTNVPDMTTAFHTYSLEWFADRLDFYVDSTLVATYTNAGTGADQWPFFASQYLILGMGIGGSWGGQQGIDDNIFPVKYYIDYVRYYTRQ